jgi:23S rRNA (cytosine1962-C5)-methyltransferase
LELGFLGVYLKAHLKTAELKTVGANVGAIHEPDCTESSLLDGVQGGLRSERSEERRSRSESPLLCGARAPDQLQVREDLQRMFIWLNEGQATGLFLDQRDNRAQLRAAAEGKRVLNLFCYTGSFTVAAAVGGAIGTVSVDTSAKALRRTGENLALNGCQAKAHRLLKDDARKWLGRAQRRAERFDWIILDPPSFSRMGGDSFSVSKDYAQMARQCLELLNPGGQLLAVTNHRGTTGAGLIALLKDAAAASRRTLDMIELQPPPADCCDAQGSSATKSVLLRVAS